MKGLKSALNGDRSFVFWSDFYSFLTFFGGQSLLQVLIWIDFFAIPDQFQGEIPDGPYKLWEKGLKVCALLVVRAGFDLDVISDFCNKTEWRDQGKLTLYLKYNTTLIK